MQRLTCNISWVPNCFKCNLLTSFRSDSGHLIATSTLTAGSSGQSGLIIISSVSLKPPSLPPLLLLLLLGCNWTSPLPTPICMESLDSLFHHRAPSNMKPWKYRQKKNSASILVVYVICESPSHSGAVWRWMCCHHPRPVVSQIYECRSFTTTKKTI